MRRKAKRDSNEAGIVKALRAAGYSVTPLDGEGVPDLLVGAHGKNILLEVKGKRGRITSAQKTWHERWQGQVAVIRTAEDALGILDEIVKPRRVPPRKPISTETLRQKGTN